MGPSVYFWLRDKPSLSRGFTLTELLMAMMITAILFVILGNFLTNFYQNREAYKVMMELQEQTHYGMERIINGHNRATDPYYGVNPRYGGILWASKYYTDYYADSNKILIDDDAREDAIEKVECDPSPDNVFKRIFFPDYTQDLNDHDCYLGVKNYIGYVQKDDKLWQLLLFQDPNKNHKKTQVIPYLVGSRGYKQDPYTVEVKFLRGIDPKHPPKGIDPNVVNPNQVVSIHLKMTKDKLNFELHSTVTLRNYDPSN